jgi:WD40 repeat protein
MKSGSLLRKLPPQNSSVVGLALSPDGRTLAVATAYNSIHMWNVDTAEALASLKGLRGQANQVAFSPDGSHLAAGTNEGMLQLWHVKTLKLQASKKGHLGKGGIKSLAFHPKRSILVTGTPMDADLYVWDVNALTR